MGVTGRAGESHTRPFSVVVLEGLPAAGAVRGVETTGCTAVVLVELDAGQGGCVRGMMAKYTSSVRQGIEQPNGVVEAHLLVGPCCV